MRSRRPGWPAVVLIALGWVALVYVLPWMWAIWSLARMPAGGSGGYAVIGIGHSTAFLLLACLPPAALLFARWYAGRHAAS